jgi:hypothetical protein
MIYKTIKSKTAALNGKSNLFITRTSANGCHLTEDPFGIKEVNKPSNTIY